MERKIYLYFNEILAMLDGNYHAPITCEIDPSNRCQLNCSFCMYKKFRNDENVDLDFDIYTKLLKDLSIEKVKSITFTGGGEPLLHPQIIKMITLAYETGFDIGLITNGVSLNKLSKETIEKLKFIRVSLDAANRTTYHKVKNKDLFDIIIRNIKKVKNMGLSNTFLGISYVVYEENDLEIESAKQLASNLSVDYIQFKPAWMGNKTYNLKIKEQNDLKVYLSDRYKTEDTLPCTIAGLIGIVAANAKVYYCCQYRGNKDYELGDLRKEDFNSLWKKRKDIIPNISECPQCRYMNYAIKFKEIPQMLINHRNFL